MWFDYLSVDFVTDDESSDSNINEEDSDFDEMDEMERQLAPLKKPASYDTLYVFPFCIYHNI